MATKKRAKTRKRMTHKKRASFGPPPVITPSEPEEEIPFAPEPGEPVEPAPEITPPAETATTTESDSLAGEAVTPAPDQISTIEAQTTEGQTSTQLEPLPGASETAPPTAEKSFSWANFLIGLLIGVAISVGAGGAWWYYQSKTAQLAQETKMTEVTPTPTPTPTPIPTPTPAAIDAYSITIFNGSGVSGGASRLQTSLESEGYSVADIGNAQSDSALTIISAGSEVEKSWLSDLETFLGKTYRLGDSTVLEASPNGVEVTIGSATK